MKYSIKSFKSRLPIFLLSLLVTAHKLNAQVSQIPTIIPPSPTAETFMRYGEIPVDYSTGVPNISIPIYTLQGKKLQVPISISYHASGIKVEDIPSEVGLGWALNCSGIVSRTINGIRDEANNSLRTFYTAEQLQDSLNIAAYIYDNPPGELTGIVNFEHYFNTVLNSAEDPMNDRYFYNLPGGLSGAFTYDYHDLNEDTAITLPYRPLKIQKFVSSTEEFGVRIDSFKITDDNGTTYSFVPYMDNPPQTASEWILKQMVSADCTDTITFNYSTQTPNTSIQVISQMYQGAAKDILDINCYPANIFSSGSESLVQLPAFNTPVLESIVSSKATVNFTYDNDRGDFNFLKRLSEIIITPTTSSTDTIKVVKFIPKYFGTTDENKRLGLDSLIISAPGNFPPQQYAFTYESQVLPPYPIKMTYPTFSEDFWGYYNGSNSNNLIPADFISDTSDKASYGGNRDPDTTGYYSKACMLKEIKYPTGGKTVFEFERNYAYGVYPYKSGNQNGCVGGFRVKTFTNYTDSDEIANVRTYEYDGAIATPITQDYFSYDQKYLEKYDDGSSMCWPTYTRTLVFSNSILPLEVGAGLPIMYTTVIEYNGTTTNNTGKTVYEYNQPYSPADFLDNLEHPYQYELPWYYNTYHYDKGNYTPELISKTTYSFDGTNYHPVSKEENEYSKLFSTEYTTGIKLSRPKQYLDPDYYYVNCPFDPALCNLGPLITDYLESVIAIDAKAYREASMLTNSKNYIYDPLDSSKYVLTSTDYTYDENNLAIQEKSTISSKGDTLKTYYKYPGDFSGTAVYDSMVARHIIAPLIEQDSYKNSSFLESSKTNYHDWGNKLIAPQTIESKKQANNSDSRIHFYSYDNNGNVITVSKGNDAKNAYIWDYKSSYPIAEVKNADSSSVAYTSFEADGKGNWTFSGTPASETNPPTGSKKYTLNGSNNITKSGLNSSATYIVSYWTKNSFAFSITGTVSGYPISGRTVNGWKYFEHKITGQTSVTISGTGDIDELRLYPSNAQMTTFTYSPLVGMTSQCDPNDRIIYYQYDNFNRLSLVRDQDYNILKKICYNFAGQPEDCGVLFYNIEKSGNFTRNNCSSGYTGSTVTYTVADSTYSSSVSQAYADSLAQADVNANGQAYANSHGTCTYVCDSTSCSGVNKKCINNVCETGVKVYTDTYYDSGLHKWVCTYHYEWSDDSWSGNYIEYSNFACPL